MRQRRDRGLLSHQLLPGPLLGHTLGAEGKSKVIEAETFVKRTVKFFTYPIILNLFLHQTEQNIFACFETAKLFESAVYISGWVPTLNRLPTKRTLIQTSSKTNTEHLNGGQLALSVMRMSIGGTRNISTFLYPPSLLVH